MNPNDNPIIETEEILDNQTDDNVELSGEEELMKALESLRKSDDENEELDDEEVDESETDEDLEDDEELEEDDQEDELDDTAKGKKREQSKEENARFAAERRKKELDDAVKAELEKFKQNAPEFALAKKLSETYGQPTEQILEQINEAALKEQSKKSGVPIEFLKEQQADRQRVESVEQELNNLRFQSWKSQVTTDGLTLQSQYKMLTQEDIDQSIEYVLTHNINMPLKEAVYAVHGEKIIESLAKEKVQDDLANQSGRKKKTPLAPNNGKPAKVAGTLTADEKFIAKSMGISNADYLAYKR